MNDGFELMLNSIEDQEILGSFYLNYILIKYIINHRHNLILTIFDLLLIY